MRPSDESRRDRARRLLRDQGALAATARRLLVAVDGAPDEVRALVGTARDAWVRGELTRVDVARLDDLTERNLRTAALAGHGYRSVADVLGADPAALERLAGVGRHTARGVTAAAERLAAEMSAGYRVRLQLGRSHGDGPPPLDHATGTAVLAALRRSLDHTEHLDGHRRALEDHARAVEALLPLVRPVARRLGLLLRSRRSRAASQAALGRLEDLGTWSREAALDEVVRRLAACCLRPDPPPHELWSDLERRAATYGALLAELVPVADDAAAQRGDLSTDLAERIAAHPLDTTLLTVRLRGYQAFGARFALNQGRALLGDEMGLGKTVQAVAAMAHLTAVGAATHHLVVCPASVLVSWEREVAAHSTLRTVRLHGDRREEAWARWVAEGGVGLTTFAGLAGLPTPGDGAAEVPAVTMLVVDEAHLVKNPRARRSRLVARWAGAVPRVLLMTGTPMENRLEEFLALVRLVDPEREPAVPPHAGLLGRRAFRSAVAPLYLRRNQEDVLVELPELVEVEEWEEPTPAAAAVYAAAVAAGNLMAMRRAAWLTPRPEDSTKLGRLLEIVDDAEANGHRVVVFSYFRDVLGVVADALGPARVHGPVTGSVPPQRRQEAVDGFAAAPPGAVLLAQVQAGGVGMNIQAASVVVLCEPQLKPGTEDQAVARVHRMGQVRTVVVHRLLTPGAVDERIRDVLAAKRRAFDAYVRESALAERSLDAVDVTVADLAREVVEAEQARLGYGPVWDGLLEDAEA